MRPDQLPGTLPKGLRLGGKAPPHPSLLGIYWFVVGAKPHPFYTAVISTLQFLPGEGYSVESVLTPSQAPQRK